MYLFDGYSLLHPTPTGPKAMILSFLFWLDCKGRGLVSDEYETWLSLPFFLWGWGGNEMSMAPSKMDPLRSRVTIIYATNARSENFTMALDASYCEKKYKGKSDVSACLAVYLKDSRTA